MGLIATTLLSLLPLISAAQDDAKTQELREGWVEELFQAQPETRLVDLILPGTHDSGSYAITKASPPAPGAPASYAQVGLIAAKWAKTQDQTLEEQLRGGIRYLDLRVADFEDRLVLVHGLVSCDLDDALAGVRRFTAEHPKEPILLDLQAMPPRSAHSKLHELLQETLGEGFDGLPQDVVLGEAQVGQGDARHRAQHPSTSLLLNPLLDVLLFVCTAATDDYCSDC